MNRPLVRVLLFVIVTTLLAGCYLRPLPGTEEHGDEKVIIEGLNGYVLDIISGYEGDYPYLLNDDYENYNGVTEDLIYQGEIIARPIPAEIEPVTVWALPSRSLRRCRPGIWSMDDLPMILAI